MANICTPIDQLYPDEPNLFGIRLITGVGYVLIFLIATVGNVAVLYGLIFRSLEMNVRNVFIWSLTMADILVCLTSLPVTALHSYFHQWLFGSVMCYVVPLLQGSSIFITSFTLVAIAWDRYRLVCYPLSTQNLKLSTASILVILLWIFGVAFACPYGLSMNFVSNYTMISESGETIQVCGEYCEEIWVDDRWKFAFTISSVLLQYVGPLVFCTICYLRIVTHLRKNQTRQISNEAVSLNLKAQLKKRKRKVNRMIGAMLVSFILAWLPLVSLQLYKDFTAADNSVSHILNTFAHMTAMTSLIWNPVIYCYCNDQFRSLFFQCAPTKTPNFIAGKHVVITDKHECVVVQNDALLPSDNEVLL